MSILLFDTLIQMIKRATEAVVSTQHNDSTARIPIRIDEEEPPKKTNRY